MRRSRTLEIVCALGGAAALAAVVAAPPALADEGPSGSAYALSVKTTLLDAPLVTIDPLPTATYPQGGDESVLEVGPNLAGLVTAKVLNASSKTDGDALASEASIAEVVVKDILSAKVVTAECRAGVDGVTGTSAIAELTVLGQPIDVDAKADVDVLGVAKVKINEQIKDGNTLTVNAVHVIVGGPIAGVTSADIVLSQAKCSPDASGVVPSTPSTPTTTTAPGTTVPAPTSSEGEPVPTTSTSADTGAGTTSSNDVPGGIDLSSNDGDLAETGVNSVLPLSLGGLLLLGGGAAFLYFTNRRRAAANAPSED